MHSDQYRLTYFCEEGIIQLQTNWIVTVRSGKTDLVIKQFIIKYGLFLYSLKDPIPEKTCSL